MLHIACLAGSVGGGGCGGWVTDVEVGRWGGGEWGREGGGGGKLIGANPVGDTNPGTAQWNYVDQRHRVVGLCDKTVSVGDHSLDLSGSFGVT